LRALRNDGLVITVQGVHGSRIAWYELATGIDAKAVILADR
jgi:hypothetical protein